MTTPSVRDNVNRLLSKHWAGRTLPVDPFELAHKEGIELRVAFDLPLRWDPMARTIHYNPNERQVRQRFALAHGLGHAVLGHPSALQPCSFYLDCSGHEEQEANLFAREVLMPAGSVKLMLVDLGHTDLGLLAQHFDVSEVAMRCRLVELGYLS